MQIFKAEILAHAGHLFGGFETVGKVSETLKLSEPVDGGPFLPLLPPLRAEFETLGMQTSARMVDRIITAIASGCTAKALGDLVAELRRRFEDEIEGVLFLHIPFEKASLFRAPRQGWEQVIDSKFPSVVRDVEEAGKCQALGRYTASAFHLMRVMEVGLRALGRSLNDPGLDPSRNPSWEAILRKCDAALRLPLARREPDWQADEVFFSTATLNIRAVKDAWRNPTMHVEMNYTEEEAEEVYATIKAFMRHLASKLSE